MQDKLPDGGVGENPEGLSDALQPNIDEAIGHLTWFRGEGPWTLTAISADRGGSIRTATFGPETEDDCRKWLEKQSADEQNLYFMVNPARSALKSKAKKEDVEELAWLHVDVDPVKGQDPAEARAAALEKLHAFDPPPSLIIDSGGGLQGFWRLQEGLYVGGNIPMAEEAEAYNQQLETLLGGDACHNVDRIMRLPGTINRPNEKKRKAGRVPRLASTVERHDDRVYGLGQFTAAPRVQIDESDGIAAPAVKISGNLPRLKDLDELPETVTPRTRMLIVQGDDPDDQTRYASRSEVTFAVCCELIRAGCDDDMIAAVLLDPDFGISGHTLAQKRSTEYAARQIQRAREAVAKGKLGPGGRRVLNPLAPYEIAERLKAELFPTAIHTNDDWLEYEAGAYRDREDATIRATLYRELSAALVSKVTDNEVEYLPFHPDSTKVNKVLDALEGVAHRPSSDMTSQAWLEGDGPPAEELLACRTGLLHVPSGDFLDPTPSFFTRNALDLEFDPNAPEPHEWLAFVNQVFPDPDARELLQDWFGYLLLPDTSQEKMLLMIGPPRSGKGTIQKVMTALVGRSNVCAPSVKALGTPFGLQPLIGKTVAFLSDLRLGGMADGEAIAETLLRITGRDDVTADRKHKEAWEGRLATRFVVSSNVLPRLSDASPALANRFSVLRMQESFLGREDPGLADRLLGELPGILLWALVGWRRLRDRGRFVLPGTSQDAVQDLFNQGSDIAAFVHDRCEEGLGYDVEKERLYALYRDWCDRTGRKLKNDAAFATELYAATSNRVTSKRPSRGGERVNVYAGIRIRNAVLRPEAVNSRPDHDDPY